MLVPSLWYEPFGIVALEAMAFGIPLITSDRGGLKEIVEENNVGFSCDPQPKIIVSLIEKMISNRGLYERFSRNGIKNIRRYDPKIIFKKYKKIFEELVK